MPDCRQWNYLSVIRYSPSDTLLTAVGATLSSYSSLVLVDVLQDMPHYQEGLQENLY
jgi:hypothetical protein